MRAAGSLSAAEAQRKLVHIAVGASALLLRWMNWPEAALMALAAFLFNWRVLPKVGGRALWREGDHGRGYPPGILLYPLAVLGLVLVFRHELWKAAAVWAVLAAGDGMASLAGQWLDGPRLPWNPRKTWAGSAAFVAFGALAADALTVWTLRLPVSALAAPWLVAGCLLLALGCALVESLSTTLDDNLTVPVAGALAIALLADVKAPSVSDGVDLGQRVLTGLAVSVLLATAAWAARSLDLPGAVSTAAIGTMITAGLGLPGLAVMATFFAAGTAATRLGYQRKADRGIAEARGGRRGWRSAWANGGVPAGLALVSLATPAQSAPVYVLAYAASVATAAADTCSSEVGKAYGRRTIVLTTLRPVTPGTEGGVSLEGTLAGLAAAAMVGAVGAVVGLYGAPSVVLVTTAGLLGALAESVLGAAAEQRPWLGNDVLNTVNTAIGAAVGALMAKLAW